MCFAGHFVTPEGRPPWRPFAFLGVGMDKRLALVDEEAAAFYAGRPGSTIRRWASEGRIARYPVGSGKVRYDVFELRQAERDEWTGELITPGRGPAMPGHPKAA